MGHALDLIVQQIRGAWRFRRAALLVAWLVCLIGWLIVLAWPDTYSAGARVYIDTRTRLSQVTKDIAVESNIAAQAEGVREALLGGPQLEKVARLAIPGFAAAPPDTQADIVQELRTSLDVQASSEREGLKNQPADLYTITYTNRNRETARRVVDQLLRIFLANSLGGSQEGSEQAQQFLSQQIAEYDKKLAAAEARLADFKREHAGLVPGATGGDYFSRLHAETDELDRDRLALTLAEQKRDELQRQLSSETGSTNGGGADTATQIRDTQARLDELLLRFTDKHPDVIAARRTLEDLKVRQKAEIEAVRRGDQAAIAATGLASSPVYQGIKLQLSQIDVEVAGARQQVAGQEAKIAEQRKMINTAPQVEAEYERLDRDYSVTHTEYQALVDRLSRAKLSDKADATGVVRFEVVDPPAVNPDPVFPNRLKLILEVLAAGLGAGIGAAYLLHQLRPVFSSTRQLMELTQLPVLGSVSMTWPERHRAGARRAVWRYALGATTLVLLAVVVLLTDDITSQFLHRFVA
ncbi:MAG TPA: XrtA system polysaccharide chain length determinant [Acetobacteraceae bacterium]|nr:XrtA system polysaccharide chain length determinant [Acetobacteraceae bacterium]